MVYVFLVVLKPEFHLDLVVVMVVVVVRKGYL